MTKEELQRQIRVVRQQLCDTQYEQRQLEEKWDVLLEFSAQSLRRAESFLASVARKKTRLSRLDRLAGRMKSAMRYRMRMEEMLVGQEYAKAKGAIDSLMDDLERQKSKLKAAMAEAESRLDRLRYRLEQLEYELRCCEAKEDKADG